MFKIPLDSVYSEIHGKHKIPRLMTRDVEMHETGPIFIFEMEVDIGDGLMSTYTHVGGHLIIDPDDPSVGRPVVATLVHYSRDEGRVHIPLRKMEYIKTFVDGKIIEQLHCTSLFGDVITLDVDWYVNWKLDADLMWDFYTFAQAGVCTGNEPTY